MEFKIGADPEFFLRDKATGKFVSAHGLIPGTKRQPMKVDKGAVQVDGMALEFNIDPVTNLDDWHLNITTVLTQLREMIDPQLEFVFTPVAQFGKDYIDSQPDVAKELGCEPDYNAYTGEINPKPNADLGFRTASGHVHIGWTDQQDITNSEHIDACHMLVKQLDCFLLLPSFAWDQDDVRASMYGAPGAYRPKHYGVEYRVLSNVWVNNPDARAYVFNQTQQAAKTLMQMARVYESYPNLQKWLNEDASMARLHNSIRYNNGHRDPNDYNWLDSQFKKLKKAGYERPIIKARMDKLNEMFVIHKTTGDLVAWEEVGEDFKSYHHPNEYIYMCLKYQLGKPENESDAITRYTTYIAETAAAKKKSKDRNTLSFDWGSSFASAAPKTEGIVDELLLNMSAGTN
jgi:hypothetical protein